jgi:2-polyprenyl-3-methyl-5-hydroxy-6-metoxy-1,4-benzoquinol methylase
MSATAAGGGDRGRSGVRAFGRALLWPVRRILDPRFAGLAGQIESESHVTREHLGALSRDYHQELLQGQEALRERVVNDLHELRNLAAAEMDTAAEASTLVAEALADVAAQLEAVRIEARLPSGSYFEHIVERGVDSLDASAAEFLNAANSHEGFAAERDLWFNWPVTLAYEDGDVRLGNVNERIVELPYAFRALSELEPGARILDVGAAESTVAFSLASLGYAVTALDPRPYPLEHPNLTVAVGAIEDLTAEEPFDAVVCISTLEHIGTGEYGQASEQNGDAAALERFRALIRDGGVLVLTTPYDEAADGGVGARVYDRARLDELLAEWNVEDLTVVSRRDATTWSPGDATGGEAVALVTARK